MLSYVYVYILRVQAGIPRKNRFQSNIINKKPARKKNKNGWLQNEDMQRRNGNMMNDFKSSCDTQLWKGALLAKQEFMEWDCQMSCGNCQKWEVTHCSLFLLLWKFEKMTQNFKFIYVCNCSRNFSARFISKLSHIKCTFCVACFNNAGWSPGSLQKVRGLVASSHLRRLG